MSAAGGNLMKPAHFIIGFVAATVVFLAITFLFEPHAYLSDYRSWWALGAAVGAGTAAARVPWEYNIGLLAVAAILGFVFTASGWISAAALCWLAAMVFAVTVVAWALTRNQQTSPA
ncbi:MAG TPA: hypothetical protein VFY28_01705 [Candidatus Paceibacterota bacterium]|nr:hypothetical protein [Candidatus Paceibacterota bacterium]